MVGANTLRRPPSFAGLCHDVTPWRSVGRVPYVATRSMGLYLLLEGPVPRTILYPARRGTNLRIRTPTWPCWGPRGSPLRPPPMGQDAGGTFPKRGDYRFLTYTKPRSLLIPYIRTPPCIRPGLCVLPRMRLPRTRVNKSALQNTSTVSGQVRRRRLPGAAALRPLYQHKHALRAECEGRT